MFKSKKQLDTETSDIEPILDSENISSSDENVTDVIKKLKEKIKILESEKQEYLTGWQREKADFINARKRDEADRAEFMKFANEQLMFDLIPVLMNWDMAMSHKDSWEKADKTWRVGVESIMGLLKKTLFENGLAEIDPVGLAFDHARHEALSYESVNDASMDHKIVSVIQKGYSYNGKVLKPAKVKVGEFKS